MIDPASQKKFERDPEDANIPTGLYTCELMRVQEIGPSPKFPGGNNRLVFEFALVAPSPTALRGKHACAFIGKTLLKNKEGRESNLVKWARMMGISNPEKGFDPDTLIGRKFNVMVEYTEGTGGESGRGWARSAILAQAAPVVYDQIPGEGPPPEDVPAPDPLDRWDYHNGTAWQYGASTIDLSTFLAVDPARYGRIWVKVQGADNKTAKKANAWGFRPAAVEVPDEDLIPF